MQKLDIFIESLHVLNAGFAPILMIIETLITGLTPLLFDLKVLLAFVQLLFFLLLGE